MSELHLFGWHLGIGEPVRIGPATMLLIVAVYYLALLAGFITATYLTWWMSPTYGASSNDGG